MDSYPARLAPRGDESKFQKELFAPWWARIGAAGFPCVPKNLARQWLWKHWGKSDFRELPSMGVRFQLECWSLDQISRLQIWRAKQDEYRRWGQHLLAEHPPTKADRYRVPGIMARSGIWPAPILVLDHDGRFRSGELKGLPQGLVLVEGNRRLAVALALSAENGLAPELPVWVLTY